MSLSPQPDWNPETYSRFRGLRLRPGLDLLANVDPALPDGPVVDLGCGAGALGLPLAARYPGRRLIGVDQSPSMLREARGIGCYDAAQEEDIAVWAPEAPPALIFANASLHLLPNHEILLPRLAHSLLPGGSLAVQVPDQQAAPSHSLLREVSARLFPSLFDWRDWAPEVLAPGKIDQLLAPLGHLDMWQTTYYQRLAPETRAHPVRLFTESTAARPVLCHLDPDQTEKFLDAYDTALEAHYPRGADGSVVFPFRRLFVVLKRPG